MQIECRHAAYMLKSIRRNLPDQFVELTTLETRRLPDRTDRKKVQETGKRLFASAVSACHYTEDLQGQTTAFNYQINWVLLQHQWKTNNWATLGWGGRKNA